MDGKIGFHLPVVKICGLVALRTKLIRAAGRGAGLRRPIGGALWENRWTRGDGVRGRWGRRGLKRF